MGMSIPAFHVSDISKVDGNGDVFIASRKDAVSSGVFTLRTSVHFDPAVDPYPAGTLTLKVDLSDGAKGVFTATSIELINSYGKHNPTVYLTGRCNGDATGAGKGLRYWVLIADNKPGADPQGGGDVVGFAIHDNNGNRVAYGIGPLRSGAFSVMPK
jgi:hypothetical protein